MSIIDSRRARKGAPAVLLTCLLLLAGACASVPYQQMSDARQAIDAAASAVTDSNAGGAMLERARERIAAAERRLERGDYAAAREAAEQAKSLAIEARERARDAPGQNR